MGIRRQRTENREQRTENREQRTENSNVARMKPAEYGITHCTLLTSVPVFHYKKYQTNSEPTAEKLNLARFFFNFC